MRATVEFDEITVFGARGHSLMILRGMEEYWRGRVRIRALIDDIENGFTHPVLDVPVISSGERLRDHAGFPVLLAVGSGSLRARMAERFATEGATLATAICPDQAHVDPSARFGAGSVCVPHARIGPNVRIGAVGQVLASVVGHDTQIGDNVTLGVEALLLGHVRVGDNVNIASRAVIANGTRTRPLRIGDGAEIGIGAVVLRDVGPGERMIGNPAMPIRDWIRIGRLLKAPQGG